MSVSQNFDRKFIWHPYQQCPNHHIHHLVKSATGSWLTLSNNKKVIDGMSSWWSVIHGYNHPTLNQAIRTQLGQMAHVMFGGLTHQPAIDLAKQLINITPKSLTQVFFSDSGSVAVEVAMKMALQYQQASGRVNKNRFITVKGGYHGDTFGAMSVCDPINGMHYLFNNVLPQHFFVKQPNDDDAIDDLEEVLKNNNYQIAAMILEPIVQGAGGMRFYSDNYLEQVRLLCDKYEVLLVIDEIATGFGRTGKLFASQWSDISADILCLGKALTGGYLSLGATLTSLDIADRIGVLMHGPTFMANPLACCVASASIDLLLASNWQVNIIQIEQYFKQQLLPLKQYQHIKDVRVLGAIAVIQTQDNININEIQDKLIDQGVWLRPFGKLLYSMPNFNITQDELFQLTQAIISVLTD